jgi:WD40 repeat protein
MKKTIITLLLFCNKLFLGLLQKRSQNRFLFFFFLFNYFIGDSMKRFLFLMPLLLLVIQMAFSQTTEEKSDTVWTKFTYPNSINAVKFTPDGKYLASGGSDGIPRLWDATTGELVKEFKGNGWAIWGLDINNAGELIATVNSLSVVTIWNLQTGEIVKIIDVYPNQDHGLEGNSITFSNNGQLIAANIVHYGKTGIEPAIFIWSVQDWQVKGKIENIINPFHVTFSPDDAILAVSNIVNSDKNTTIGLYKVPSLIYIGLLDNANENGVNQSVFSSNGDYLAGALTTTPNKVWKTSDWKFFRSLGQGSDSRAVTFSSDNKFVVMGGGSFSQLTTDIYDINTGKLIYAYNNRYLYSNSDISNSIDIKKDMKYIAVGGAFGIYMLHAKWEPTSVNENPVQISEPLIFPNPSNKTANIRFNLIKSANVSIGIYDINSNQIAKIYDGYLESGLQNFAWKVSPVSTGTYFARITASGTTSSIKIIVNK